MPSSCSRASMNRTRRRYSKGCRNRSASRSSAACFIRKIPPAGGCRPSSSRCRRTGTSGRRSTTCAIRPTCRIASTRSMRSTTAGTGRARSRWNVGQAIDYMRDTPDLPDRFYEIYAVDDSRRWQGAVSLDTLLRARRPVPLADLIEEDRRRVSVMDDQEEVARLFGKYNLVAAPVVDTADRLVGVVTIDDVVG